MWIILNILFLYNVNNINIIVVQPNKNTNKINPMKKQILSFACAIALVAATAVGCSSERAASGSDSTAVDSTNTMSTPATDTTARDTTKPDTTKTNPPQ